MAWRNLSAQQRATLLVADRSRTTASTPPGDWRLVFALPCPPSVNALYVPTPGGLKLSKHAKAWTRVAHHEMLAQLTAADRQWLPYAQPVAVTLDVYKPQWTGYDLDNLRKLAYDALEGLVLVNDEQIVEDHGYKHVIDTYALPTVSLTVTPWRKEG